MPTEPTTPARPVLPGRGKVLVVDDSSAMRLALESVLAVEHQVFTAANGPEGLAIAASERPDVILLDVVMAGMDGYAVLEQLKSKFPLPPPVGTALATPNRKVPLLMTVSPP